VFDVLEAGELEYVSKDQAYDTYPVQFSCYADTPQGASDLIRTIWNELEDNDLSISRGSFVSMYRGGVDISIDPELEQAGTPVWRGTLIVDVEIGINR
jgi:hypothetical protein